jgi:hypothetical protein
MYPTPAFLISRVGVVAALRPSTSTVPADGVISPHNQFNELALTVSFNACQTEDFAAVKIKVYSTKNFATISA